MRGGWVAVRIGVVAVLAICGGSRVGAQSYGVELHNSLMPASGGMGGVSLALPQDLVSAINGNPATLTQFDGAQFHFGGAWAEPTFNIAQASQLPLVGPAQITPYAAKSTAQGLPAGNIGVTQRLDVMGVPTTAGIGFMTTSGGFVDFRQMPQSNGTNTGLAVFSLPMTLGVELTERWSVGGGMALGIAFFDGPFVDIGGMTTDTALRGTVGTNYQLTDATAAGFYYQTGQSFTFDHAVQLTVGPNTITEDVRLDLPQNIGFGVANRRLLDGRLLLGMDVLLKLWDSADLFSAIYDDQWVVQFGAQYSVRRLRLRAGYAWAENPLDDTPDVNLGGVIPVGGLPSVRYSQALLAVTSQHRISGGIGVVDVLPNVDLDLMAGGMFRDQQQLGPFTSTSIESYWIGLGLTWRCCGGCRRADEGCSSETICVEPY